MKNKIFFLILVIATPAISCKDKFITVEDSYFVKNGKIYNFCGYNFWYGAILGSIGEGGDRERLIRELDYLASIGVDNLRVLVGADGEKGIASRVEPTLQIEAGVYNDTLLDGLDFFLSELQKRDMYAVLYLNNSWEWSGGYSMYLQWAGYGEAPIPAQTGWDTFNQYVSQFVMSDSAKALFANHVKFILSRTNRYTREKYTDDPNIMAWQIGNEPRCFSSQEENKKAFAQWTSDVASLIKSIDKNHLLTTGSEGKHGCEGDLSLFETIHADANIDYLEVHIWPYNWEWILQGIYAGVSIHDYPSAIVDSVDAAIRNTKLYLDEHLAIAEKLHKPLVLGEFGYPRDNFEFSPNSSVIGRKRYFDAVFDLVGNNDYHKAYFAGCNVWAWGGFGIPKHIYWQKGDDYIGDPAQEEQGLNSVFVSDFNQ